MSKVNKFSHSTTTHQDVVLNEIRNICLENPQSNVAVRVKNMIDKAAIPIQMDKDIIRRLTDPACNPLDMNFNMPLSAMTKNYAHS